MARDKENEGMDHDSRIGRWLPAGLVLVAAIGAGTILMSHSGRMAGGEQVLATDSDAESAKEPASSIDQVSASAGSSSGARGAGSQAAGEPGAADQAGAADPVAGKEASRNSQAIDADAGRAMVLQIDHDESAGNAPRAHDLEPVGLPSRAGAGGRNELRSGASAGVAGSSGTVSVERIGGAAVRPSGPGMVQVPVNRPPLDLPESTAVEPPPPPGFARLRTGSIPVERALMLDGDQVSSFTLYKRVFEPGQHRVRLESARGCVEFSIDLKSDEIVYLIWDFEQGGWRRHERVGASRTSPVTPAVSACGGAR